MGWVKLIRNVLLAPVVAGPSLYCHFAKSAAQQGKKIRHFVVLSVFCWVKFEYRTNVAHLGLNVKMCITENASIFPHENKMCCFVVTFEIK